MYFGVFWCELTADLAKAKFVTGIAMGTAAVMDENAEGWGGGGGGGGYDAKWAGFRLGGWLWAGEGRKAAKFLLWAKLYSGFSCGGRAMSMWSANVEGRSMAAEEGGAEVENTAGGVAKVAETHKPLPTAAAEHKVMNSPFSGTSISL